jgi:hypothetical protein
MIPTIEEIVAGLIAGTIAPQKAIAWLNKHTELSALASLSDDSVRVPREIDRSKHRRVLEVWNQCMADCETLEMAWPKLVKAASEDYRNGALADNTQRVDADFTSRASAPEASASPKFSKTFCSQCGQEFGPGDHGFSHCSEHQGKVIGQSGILTPEDRPFPDKLRSAAQFLRDCHDNLDAREAEVIARNLEEAAAELERARGAVTQEMVDRFLRWPLPASVCSDTCVTTRDYPHQRSGTNLLTHDEARQMLEFVLTASPPGGFSDFIRNASPEEKERVYQGVMERAAERQKAVEAGVEEPQRWNKADHHASCHPTDSSLVWQCGQCGHVAAADDVDAHIAGLTARLRDEQSENEVLREQNFAMNKTIAELTARLREMGEELRIVRGQYQREEDLRRTLEQQVYQAERDREALRKELLRLRDVVSDVDAEIIDAALSAREGGK